MCQESDELSFFGKRSANYGTLSHSYLDDYGGALRSPTNMSAPKTAAAQHAQNQWFRVLERDCKALGNSSKSQPPDEGADMTFLRSMLDLDWWRRPNASIVERFFRDLSDARGCLASMAGVHTHR